MASWTGNPIMEWSTDGGTTWTKISDHGRAALSLSVERLENKQRMADGTMRRYTVAKKRTWTTSWDNLPDKQVNFLANGQCGNWMENFHNTVDKDFLMRLRAGSDRDLSFTGTNGVIVSVMLTDFSKDITRRTINFDLLSVSITLEEV